MSVAAEIGAALAARIATITAANGWPVPFNSVFYDKIPMGLELAPEQMPSAFVIDEAASYGHEHQVVTVVRAWRIQIVDQEEASDSRMMGLVSSIARAVYANDPLAQVQDQFRIHPKVVWIELDSDEGDLHMIPGNRIATFRFLVHYRTRPYDL